MNINTSTLILQGVAGLGEDSIFSDDDSRRG